MLPPFTTTVQNSYRYTTAHTRETICYFCLPLKSFLHRKPDLITLQSPRPRRYHRLKFPNNCHRSGEPFHSFQPVRILICVFPAGGLPQIARTCYSSSPPLPNEIHKLSFQALLDSQNGWLQLKSTTTTKTKLQKRYLLIYFIENRPRFSLVVSLLSCHS